MPLHARIFDTTAIAVIFRPPSRGRSPHHGDAMTEREAFGPTLRQHRERRGVTLEAIADRSKIGKSLFVALERGDVKRWPTGIYRRAFFRDYASAIGVPVEAMLQDFLRLFPEPGQEPRECDANEQPVRLRVTLVPEDRWMVGMRQIGAAGLDTAIVLVAGYVLSLLARLDLWMAIAAIGLSYQALSTLVFGQGFGAWCLAARAMAGVATPRQAIQIELLRRQWLWDFLTSPAIRIRRRTESSLEPSL
jgi:transcriptional regulator with XRE-family HTH domain